MKKHEKKTPNGTEQQSSPVELESSPQEAAADAPDQKIMELEASVKKEQESYLRLRAEFDNYRKRMQQEKEELSKYAGSKVIMELLPVIDNFERARQSFEKHHEEVDEIIKGVALIHKQLEDLLQKLGVKKIECFGQKFDPESQEAIMQKEVTEGEDNIVLEMVQPGYVLEDKVIRHAMVIVSKKLQIANDK